MATIDELIESSRELAKQEIAEASRTAYDLDFRIFTDWAEENCLNALPASEETILAYIAECLQRDLAVSTLSRYLTSIRKKHRELKLPDETKTEMVRAAVKGYRRAHGIAPKQAKPITFEQLVRMVQALGSSIKGLRDAAILTIGWSAALRRSEIAALERDDIESVPEGLIVKIRRSKTDQEGAGRSIGIPFGSDKFCPVQTIRRWYTIAQIESGPLFVPTFRRSNRKMFRTSKHDRALSDRTIAEIVKSSLELAGYDSAGYSGHSLRAGFCTQAAALGIPEWAIMRHTRHLSERTLHGYIREGSLWRANPLEVILGIDALPLQESRALLESNGLGLADDVSAPPEQAGDSVALPAPVDG